MTSGQKFNESLPTERKGDPTRLASLAFLLLMPLVVGCEGCRSKGQAENPDEEIRVDPFASKPIQTLPSNDQNSIGVKPSHWVSARQTLKSNQSDVRGELVSSFNTINRPKVAVGEQVTRRPVILPRGQWRRLDYRVLPQKDWKQSNVSYVFNNQLNLSGQFVQIPGLQKRLTPNDLLQPQEYFFLILTERPERFTRLQAADWVRFRPKAGGFSKSESNFRVVAISQQDGLLPLPDTLLDWTATAVVFWDDLPSESLTPRQQQAIADWIRFGGCMVINGAAPSENLGYTELADLLPMEMETGIELDVEQARKILTNWSVASDRSLEKQSVMLGERTDAVSFQGELDSDASYFPKSGDLLVSKRVGRGRVIQSRFDLTSDWLEGWDSYDSFFNGVILGRPNRAIRESEDEFGDQELSLNYPEYDLDRADAAFNTRFRITSRDRLLFSRDTGQRVSSSTVSQFDAVTAIDTQAGIGGWRDDSDFIRVSKDILRKESGIRVPDSFSVIKSLVLYLIVLIPINYLVFRTIGRLEWFWYATPGIAVIGAMVVAKTAQLDIGFARSQTELSLLEIHSDYSRGHLTRLVSVYNSLTTNYEVDFESTDVAVMPIKLQGQSRIEKAPVFELGRSGGPRLTGFPIQSNQVRMLRVEQMIDLGGGIVLSSMNEINNQTAFGIEDAFVIGKTASNQYQVAEIGTLAAGERKKLRFIEDRNPDVLQDSLKRPNELMNMLNSFQSILPGSFQLVGRYDGVLDGMQLTPRIDQKTGQTLVVVHLRYPDWMEPKRDTNLIGDFRATLGDEDDDESLEESAGND